MILQYCREGLPIELDLITKEFIYKKHRVLVNHIKKAFESGRDKVELTDTLSFFKSQGLVEFGCLTLTETEFKQILLKAQKELKSFNK